MYFSLIIRHAKCIVTPKFYPVDYKGKGHPRTGHEGPEGNRWIAVLFLQHGARWGWVVKATPRPLYPWERYQVPIIWKVGWDTGPAWTGAEKRASTVI